MTDGTVQERWCHVTGYDEDVLVFCCIRLQIAYRKIPQPDGFPRIGGYNGIFVRGRDLPYLNELCTALPSAFGATRVPACNLEVQDALTAMRVLGVPPEQWAAEAVAFLTGTP